MARARGRAFLDTGRAEICGVAARRAQRAASCAAELGCDFFCDDFRRLEEAGTGRDPNRGSASRPG